ncbi:DUF4303 domain-containing protein [Stenotrophomonas maltophilia]|nr:DUF4303 domain-containing protein [Stenotrophomonas maltophilia]
MAPVFYVVQTVRSHVAPLRTTHMQVPPPRIPTQDMLRDALISAIRTAVAELKETDEHFYYVALMTTGEALAPVLCAWSSEALQRTADAPFPLEASSDLKWSCIDAPYFDVGREALDPVHALFAARPAMNPFMPEADWMEEYAIRLGAMEEALHALDTEGFFGTGFARETVLINVEVIPPDHSNILRARRLNPRAALARWLSEVADPTDAQ